MDFVSERLENGRQVRILAVLECFTRECLLLKAASHFPSVSVQRELEWLFPVQGGPSRIVSDNRAQFGATDLTEYVDEKHFEPGWRREFGRAESFFESCRPNPVPRSFCCCTEPPDCSS